MSSIRPRALIVDDEVAIRRFLRSTLVAEDFDVVDAASLAEARGRLGEGRPDLVVLDLGLPDGNGSDLLPTLLAMVAPPPAILVLSASGEEADKVALLDAGADDFVTKPFGVGEFMARVRAALRHRLAMQGAAVTWEDARLSIDLMRRSVRVGGVDARLTPREFDLLRELVTHRGKVLTHRHLLRAVWGAAEGGDVEALRVHVRHLRQKIEPHPEAPVLVTTEPGVGYRFGG
jgi:two-component system KDP operon response regulator KdpE